MNSHRRRPGWIGLAGLALLGAHAWASEFTVAPILDLRWRQEVLDTLSANRALDHSYSYGHLRERFGGDVGYRWLTLHVLGQAANSYNVPNDASFGAGASYYALSKNNSAPSQAALAELSLIAKPNASTYVSLGRQGIKDGAEPPSGNQRLDWIEDNRVAERLIGTWEWTNVARRFDGLTAGYSTTKWNAAAFGARILQGGLAYSDAFAPLDGVETAGLSVSARPGTLLPNTELRVFNIGYRDYRPVTDTALDDSLYLDTIGMDLIGVYPSGPGAFDTLLWGAYQFGDYGAKRQSAEAFLVEGGYGLPQAPAAPWLRAGIDYASGGSPADANVHTTFVNLAPTNHKFYGIQDLNAFENLTDYFVQLMVRPASSLNMAVEDHVLRLSNTRDGWYVGSGPASDSTFGITDRLPGAGELSGNIGNELDLVTTWTPIKRLSLQAGYSHFEGGAAARTLYPVKSNANFFYFQTAWRY